MVERKIEELENEIVRQKWEGFIIGIGAGVSISCIIIDIVIIVMKLQG